MGALNWIVMGTTLAVNFFVAAYERREGRRLGSPYLVADSAHTRSDIYVTLGVVASFAGARAGLAWADGVVAAGIGIFVAFLGVQVLIGSFHTLTDRAVLASEALAAIVMAVPGVRSCRDIRTRGERGAVYVDLVVHVDGDMTLRAAHDVADRIEAALQQRAPGDRRRGRAPGTGVKRRGPRRTSLELRPDELGLPSTGEPPAVPRPPHERRAARRAGRGRHPRLPGDARLPRRPRRHGSARRASTACGSTPRTTGRCSSSCVSRR